MNTAVEQAIREADGRYFTDLELKPLEQYVHSYAARLKTYAILCQHGEGLVLQALRRLAASDAEVVQQYGEICKRDMSYVVRVIALMILKDDEVAFRQQLVLWMQNIMAALGKEEQSARAYRALQEIIRNKLPAECSTLVNQYLEEFIRALLAGVQ